MVNLGQIHVVCVGEFLVSMQFSAKKKKKKYRPFSVTSNLSIHVLSKKTSWNINSAGNILKCFFFFFFFFQKTGFDST